MTDARLIRVARALRRAFLAVGSNELNSDGRVVVRELLHRSSYFGAQFEPGNHDTTLANAVRRDFANTILKLLDPNFEAHMRKLLEIASNDD